MARSYRHIQQYEKEIIELKEKGLNQSEIVGRLSFTKEQVKGFFKRLHKKECRRYCNYSQALHRNDNLLNRDFHADRHNQKWGTDISYIKTTQGFLYLSIIRDLYDRSIVDYKTSTVQNINLVMNTIRTVKRKGKV